MDFTAINNSRVIVFLLIMISMQSFGQEGAVGIGNNNPHESAILQVDSGDKGVIFPIHDKESVVNPAMGLIVYDWDEFGYFFYDGAEWRPFSTAVDSLWNLSGDNIYSIPSKTISIGQTTTTDQAKVFIKTDDSNVSGLHVYNPLDGANAGVRVETWKEDGLGFWAAALNPEGGATGGYFYSNADEGLGVYGLATDEGNIGINKGGFFESEGALGIGVHGKANNIFGINNYGGYFESEGEYGIGVYGEAKNLLGDGNIGGVFVSQGTNGIGLLAEANGVDAIGLKIDMDNLVSQNQIGALIEAKDDNGIGLKATTIGGVATSIHAEASGEEAVGIYTSTTGDDANSILATAYGETGVAGHFKGLGIASSAILAQSLGDNTKTIHVITGGESSIGIHATTLGENATVIKAISNGAQAKGIVSEMTNVNTNDVTYAGYFLNKGQLGRAVYGLSDNSNGSVNYGGYFEAQGIASRAVYGYANHTSGENYGGYFRSTSPEGTGVYAVGTKYAGRFEGDVEVFASDGSNISLAMFEGTGFGFQFEYNGTDDNLNLWSKKFAGNEAIRMTWKKDGKVGIGTENPSEVLDVVGNINVSGNVLASCGTLSCSDQRYKTNIRNITNSLELLSKIDGVYYDWKIEEYPKHNFSNEEQVGVIAQQLEKYFPQLVHSNEEGYKSVAYDKLAPILLEAIKELNRKLEDSDSKVVQLKLRAENQELRLATLEHLILNKNKSEKSNSED